MAKFSMIFLALAGLLAIGGYANYQRNAHLDAELENRTYAGLSDEDLAVLEAAHAAERDKISAKMGGGKADPTRVMNGFAPADLDGKVHAFDHFQRRNERLKALNRVALQHQVVIDALKKERSIRERGLDNEWKRIIRRVTTF